MIHTAPRQPMAPVLCAILDDHAGPVANILVAAFAPMLDMIMHGCLENAFPEPLPAFEDLEFVFDFGKPPAQAWYVFVEHHVSEVRVRRTRVSWERTASIPNAPSSDAWTHPLLDSLHAYAARVGAKAL